MHERLSKRIRAITLSRGSSCVLLVAAAAVVGAGCGSGEPPQGSVPRYNSGQSQDQLKAEYQQSMEQMRSQLDNPEAPPLDRSIATGDQPELEQAAMRWDTATALVASLTPPKDIVADHKRLVAAMKDLGDWNRKIAAAAPNKKRTQQIAKQAQNSAAATAFGAAVDRIEAKGYNVMTAGDPAASDDPLPGASDPVG